MASSVVLFRGELQRLQRYNILAAGVVVALLWIGVMQFSGIEDVTWIFPVLIFLDATSMAILLVGAAMFFEKQEGALKTLLVSPITKGEYVLSKIAAGIALNVGALLGLYLYARLFKVIELGLLGLLGALVLVALFHSLLGFILTYYARDFTDLLMGMMKYAFIFIIPVLLEQVGMITNEIITTLLYLAPTKAAMILLRAPAGGTAPGELLWAAAYLSAASLGLYLLVLKKFARFAAKESGV